MGQQHSKDGDVKELELTGLLKKSFNNENIPLQRTKTVISKTTSVLLMPITNNVPDDEEVILSPLEKFRKYYKLPWTIIFDVILLICVITMVRF
jgi:hypothetical protein